MLTLVYAVVTLLFLVGLAGSLLPVLPGTPIILVGALIYAAATDWNPVGPGRLLILAGLSLLGYALDYVAGALGATRFGATRVAVVGAVVGGLVGVFFGPLGLLLGPIIGAIAGELLSRRRLDDSLRSGLGVVVGLVAGAVAKFALATVMVALFLWWVWHG